jgi:hypothetical protein
MLPAPRRPRRVVVKPDWGRGLLARGAQQQPEQQAAEEKRENGRFARHGGNYSGNPDRPQRGGAQAPGRGLRRFHAHTAYPDTE